MRVFANTDIKKGKAEFYKDNEYFVETQPDMFDDIITLTLADDLGNIIETNNEWIAANFTQII